MKINWKLATVGVGGTVVAGAAGLLNLLLTQRPSCGCADSGTALVSALVVMQQAFYLESGSFSDDRAAIAQEFSQDWPENERYRFDVQVSENVAYAFATPHQSTFQTQIGPFRGPNKPYFSSKVSAIAVLNDGKTAQDFSRIVCVAKDPTDLPLDKPAFNGTHFTCPANTQEI